MFNRYAKSVSGEISKKIRRGSKEIHIVIATYISKGIPKGTLEKLAGGVPN